MKRVRVNFDTGLTGRQNGRHYTRVVSDEPTVFPEDASAVSDTRPGASDRPTGAGVDGLTIPGYDMRERLGRGGFAAVYRAYQHTFDRDVAIKVLLGDLSDPADARQFTNECRALGRLSSHPAVVDVFDAGTTSEGRGYIVMRLYGGGSIAQRMKESGPLPVDDVLEIGMRMADALSSAHSQQVIHRDIKPENILIDESGRTALSDFGVAAMADPDGRFTRSLAFSRQHVAPEVLSRNAYGVASDIYGLSSTLYAMCAGRAPFHYPAEAAQISAILNEPVPPIDRPDLPPVLMELLVTGLAKDPKDRFRDARALHHALRSVRSSATSGSRALPRSPQGVEAAAAVPPDEFRERKSGNSWLPIAISAIVGIAAGAMILLALGR